MPSMAEVAMNSPRFTALPASPAVPELGSLGISSLSRRRKLNALPALNFQPLKSTEFYSAKTAETLYGESPRTSEFYSDFEPGAALGSGSVGVVFQARRRCDARQFAVKCITSEDEEVRQFTREEYELVRSLNHPAIIKFEACYESRFKMWLCMELCSDGSVDSYLGGGRSFDEVTVQALSCQILRGINYLHHRRVVHRDLKPANMVLTQAASLVKITDFNSAKRIGKAGGSDVMLSDRGTCTYSAPELRFGLLWNERVDIWAFGLSVYFMLRKTLPFDNREPQVAESLSKHSLPDISWKGISDSMRNFILQCLTVNMHDRLPAMALLLHPIIRMRSGIKLACQGQSNELEVETCSSDGQTCENKSLGDVFVFRLKIGLLALHDHRKSWRDVPIWAVSSSRTADVHRRPLSCYLFSLDGNALESEEEPRHKLSWSSSCTSWKEPHRFDALLQSAENNFCR
mmetsp:Transcript_150857/g.266796  ORF Transcript_150857/g.266796 Transcript_150857/m.266796 type:complete len:460 (-) Transcript_150857:33-1412(-)